MCRSPPDAVVVGAGAWTRVSLSWRRARARNCVPAADRQAVPSRAGRPWRSVRGAAVRGFATRHRKRTCPHRCRRGRGDITCQPADSTPQRARRPDPRRRRIAATTRPRSRPCAPSTDCRRRPASAPRTRATGRRRRASRPAHATPTPWWAPPAGVHSLNHAIRKQVSLPTVAPPPSWCRLPCGARCGQEQSRGATSERGGGGTSCPALRGRASAGRVTESDFCQPSSCRAWQPIAWSDGCVGLASVVL